MGIITKIEEQKNKNRVNIFVDDSFFCGLEKETAVIFGLKVNKEIDENELSLAIEKSEEKRAFEKSMNYLSKRMHSKFELKDKLLKKGFSSEVVSNTILKLEEYHYVDDDMFARLFIEQNSNLSKRMICNKLQLKGINKDIIDKNLIEIDSDAEIEKCEVLARKLLKSAKIENLNDKQKFVAKLVRRGFSYDVISKVLKIIKLDINY